MLEAESYNHNHGSYFDELENPHSPKKKRKHRTPLSAPDKHYQVHTPQRKSTPSEAALVGKQTLQAMTNSPNPVISRHARRTLANMARPQGPSLSELQRVQKEKNEPEPQALDFGPKKSGDRLTQAERNISKMEAGGTTNEELYKGTLGLLKDKSNNPAREERRQELIRRHGHVDIEHQTPQKVQTPPKLPDSDPDVKTKQIQFMPSAGIEQGLERGAAAPEEEETFDEGQAHSLEQQLRRLGKDSGRTHACTRGQGTNHSPAHSYTARHRLNSGPVDQKKARVIVRFRS